MFLLPVQVFQPTMCQVPITLPSASHIFRKKPFYGFKIHCMWNYGRGKALEHCGVLWHGRACVFAWGLVPVGPAWKSKLLMCPVSNVLLWDTPGTFLFLVGCVICCLGPRMSKSILDENSLPEQCHKGLQSYSGGREVPSYSSVFFL